MPFGLGFGELIIAMLLLGAPVALLVLTTKHIARALGSGRNDPQQLEHQQRAAELKDAQFRIEELEAKVDRIDEKADFTQRLLERPRTDR
jgi:cell division protein FtsL